MAEGIISFLPPKKRPESPFFWRLRGKGRGRKLLQMTKPKRPPAQIIYKTHATYHLTDPTDQTTTVATGDLSAPARDATEAARLAIRAISEAAGGDLVITNIVLVVSIKTDS